MDLNYSTPFSVYIIVSDNPLSTTTNTQQTVSLIHIMIFFFKNDNTISPLLSLSVQLKPNSFQAMFTGPVTDITLIFCFAFQQCKNLDFSQFPILTVLIVNDIPRVLILAHFYTERDFTSYPEDQFFPSEAIFMVVSLPSRKYNHKSTAGEGSSFERGEMEHIWTFSRMGDGRYTSSPSSVREGRGDC